MTAKAPTLRPSGDQDRDVFNRETRKAVVDLSKIPWATAVQLGPISMDPAGASVISHGLGRRYRRWCLVDNTTSALVWRAASATQDPAKYLVLECSIATTVSILVE